MEGAPLNIELEKLLQSKPYQLIKYTDKNLFLDDCIIELSAIFQKSKEDTQELVESVLNYYHYNTSGKLPDMDMDTFHTIIHVTQPYRIPVMTYRFENFLNFLGTQNNIRSALDYGGGGGKDSIMLARLGYDVTYADILGPQTAHIKRRFELRKLSINIVDVRFLGDKRYDCVMSMDVLEHIYDMEYVLADMYARIKLGGVLMCHPTFSNSWNGDHIEKNCAYISFFPKIISQIGFISDNSQQQSRSAKQIIKGFLKNLKILPGSNIDYCLIKEKQYADSIEVERDIVRKRLYKLSKKYSLQTVLITTLMFPISFLGGLLLLSLPKQKAKLIGKQILQNIINNITDNLAVYRLSTYRLTALDYKKEK